VVGALGVTRHLGAQHAVVKGWLGLPCTLIATPSCTVVSNEQVSGQSWGQVPKMVVVMAAFCMF